MGTMSPTLPTSILVTSGFDQYRPVQTCSTGDRPPGVTPGDGH